MVVERSLADLLDLKVGARVGLENDLNEAMEKGATPLDIVNEILLDGMRVVGDLMAARMSQFRDIVAVELPELFDALRFDPATRAALLGHARNLENWLAGILNWHQGCHRYAEADLISNARPARPELFGSPTGLGTSAVRILRTLQEA